MRNIEPAELRAEFLADVDPAHVPVLVIPMIF